MDCVLGCLILPVPDGVLILFWMASPPSAHAMMNSQEKQRANFYAVLSGNGRVRHGRSQLSFAKYPQPHPKWHRRHPR